MIANKLKTEKIYWLFWIMGLAIAAFDSSLSFNLPANLTYICHRTGQSRRNIVFLRLCGVSGIHFLRRGEQIILLFFIDCKVQSIKNWLSAPSPARGRLIKMRLPAERADAQKNSCKATIFYISQIPNIVHQSAQTSVCNVCPAVCWIRKRPMRLFKARACCDSSLETAALFSAAAELV